MAKVNKATIIKELKQLKTMELDEKRRTNSKLRKEYKFNLMNKYEDKIKALGEKLDPILDEYMDLILELKNDKDIKANFYSHSHILLFNLGSVDRAKKCIYDNSNFNHGSFSVYSHKLFEEECEMAKEWDKLILYCKSLPVKELRKYLEDNKIELECIKNENKVTETALVVQDINFNKLWGNKNVNR